MLECLILGDSIGVGIHQHRRECSAIVQTGINSAAFNKQYNGEFFNSIVIISLGSNDGRGVNTAKELQNLRSRVTVRQRVYWILPANNPDIVIMIRELAAKWGDIVVPISKLSTDGVHPTSDGYKLLANQTR